MPATLDRHSFISFHYQPRDLSSRTWFLLGEAMSKCQHLAGTPLKPLAAKELMSVYLAKGVQATTAIEGNTLSDEEVRDIVVKGQADIPESRDYLQREVQNVVSCLREIDEALHAGERLPITVDRLCSLNLQILDGIPDSPEVVPGQLREHDVVVGPYKAPHWTEVRELLERFAVWIEGFREAARSPEVKREDRFTSAVIAAILAHLYIAWIHPFGNGNGRLARLIEVQILSESGVVPMVATNLLSDHYNKTRTLYYLRLNEAQTNVSAFIHYAIEGFVDELREQIQRIRQESMNIHWESWVYEIFRTAPDTSPRARQRELALAMSGDDPISPEAATELTPSLAKKYALCGPRTPARDMNDLHKMGVVKKVGHRKFIANRKIVEAFLPPVAALD